MRFGAGKIVAIIGSLASLLVGAGMPAPASAVTAAAAAQPERLWSDSALADLYAKAKAAERAGFALPVSDLTNLVTLAARGDAAGADRAADRIAHLLATYYGR